MRLFLVLLLSAGVRHAQELVRVERTPLVETRAHLLRTAHGTRIGSATVAGTQLRLQPDGGPEILAPRLQHWVGSPDGRTLAGVGDEGALEHPFELRLVLFRDGLRVAAPEERFATESELTVGPDGTLALVGHAPGRRGEPFALVLAPDGTELHRRALPPGTLARDPQLFGQRLLVRSHGLLTEGVDGAIHVVDGAGARLLCEAPGALVLAGFPALEAALVLTRDSARLVDARDGHERWRRTLALRPAGAQAFELWRAPGRDALALVTAGLPRAGEPGPALWLLDPRDGATLARRELGPLAAPADVELEARGAELVLGLGSAREVFAWQR